LELFDHSRRERFVLERSRFAVDHISERKAGGTGIPIGTAIFSWFILGGKQREVSPFDGTTLCDLDERSVFGEASIRDPADYAEYEDVTDRTINELLEAERLAEPEDFPPMEYDMGHPIGFLECLWEIWNEKRESAA
jgi:hypothetical protein